MENVQKPHCFRPKLYKNMTNRDRFNDEDRIQTVKKIVLPNSIFKLGTIVNYSNSHSF